MSAVISRWGAPVTYVVAVVVIATSLIAILTRSPDTKSNFQDAPSEYDRTELAVIGIDDQFDGLTASLRTEPAEFYVGAGCASCHGLSGEGGVVGPDIWSKNVADTLDALRSGGNGMPVFVKERLADEHVEALVQYLNELRDVAER